MPARPTSLATRWTLRYGAASLLAFSLLGIFVYDRLLDALKGDAELLLEHEVAEVREQLHEHPNDMPGDLARMIEDDLSLMHPDLRVSFQFFDRAGQPRYGQGFLHDARVPLAAEVAGGHEASQFHEVDLGDGAPYWVLSSVAGDEGFVQAGIYARVFVRSARNIRDIFLAMIPVVVLVAAGLGFVLARGSLRPVRGIVEAARRLRSENLEQGIPTTGSGDEFDQIAAAMNELLTRIRSSMETLRSFSVDAAHQLRSPLTALRSRIEVTLETEEFPGKTRELLLSLLEEVGELGEAVDAMLRLARHEAGLDPSARVPVDLAPLLGSVVELFEPMAEERGLSLSLAAGHEATVAGDASWLRQLFVNLVENAVRFTPKGGHVVVTLSCLGGDAVVQVRDTGPGIAPEEVGRIFERFHVSRRPGERGGAGLGLALARKIAAAHGGRIDVDSVRGEGSTLTVRLPLATASCGRRAPSSNHNVRIA